MAVVCAALLVAPETIAAGPIYGVQSCSTPRVQPTRIVFACVDAGALIHNIHWRHWGGRIAVGSGTYWEVEPCRCRARSFRATVWLGDVGACPGVRFRTVLSAGQGRRCAFVVPTTVPYL